MSRQYKLDLLSYLKRPYHFPTLDSYSLQDINKISSCLKYHFGSCAAPAKVMFVGAGGVASWFLPQYIKTLFAFKTANRDFSVTTIVIYDFDILEDRNLLRQNFIPSDVGKNKAQVLAERYGSIYENIEIQYVPKYFACRPFIDFIGNYEVFPKMKALIEESPEMFSFQQQNFQSVFNFTDNEFSKHMLDFFIKHYGLYDYELFTYYCTGCDVSNGQVFVNKSSLSDCYTSYYQDISFEDLDETLEERVSCAELAEHAALEQTFDANTLAANLLNILVNNNLKNFWGNRTKEIKFICSGTPSVNTITNFDLFRHYRLSLQEDYDIYLRREAENVELEEGDPEEILELPEPEVFVRESAPETPHFNLGLTSRT